MVPSENETLADFGHYLKEKTVISDIDFSRMIAASATTGQPTDIVLIELGLVPEDQLAHQFSEYLDIRECRPKSSELDESVLEKVGIDYLLGAGVAPVARESESTSLIVADPLMSQDPDMISYLLDQPLDICCAPRSHILEALQEWKSLNDLSNERPGDVEHSAELEMLDVNRLKDVANEAPVIRLVNDIIQRAVDRKATDIHIEPSEDTVTIRFRCDGVLVRDRTVSRQLHPGLSTRLKILSQLNIAERRLPQDGRLRMPVRGQEIDLRVSILPSVHGETFVLRILNRNTVPLRLDALGYGEDDVMLIQQLARMGNGIVLVTGPTGSGKTTTLYSMINEIDCSGTKVFTVEDPVEYRMKGITQVQVNQAIELDFAKTLRTVLRQDPDVILVGEIRDTETAQIAIRAALTGHLVLSTLHTNSAAGAFSRLIDMGVEKYLLADTVRAVIGQRLLRRLCTKCHSTHNTSDCDECGNTGYRGRIAAYEILKVTADIREQINRSGTEADVLAAARIEGFISLEDHASDHVRQGLTDEKEISRVFSSGGN